MRTLSITITFHSAFRVGAASGRDGVDLAVDHSEPLGADHLKGMMRAVAGELSGLGALPPDLVDEVFGRAGGPASPWVWTPAMPSQGPWQVEVKHRVAIDADTGTAIQDHLVRGEQVWAPRGTFQILQARPAAHLAGSAAAERLDRHEALLRTCARGLHGLGAWRRRGLGRVGLTIDGEDHTRSAAAADLNLARGGTA